MSNIVFSPTCFIGCYFLLCFNNLITFWFTVNAINIINETNIINIINTINFIDVNTQETTGVPFPD